MLSIAQDQIEPTPNFGAKTSDNNFILGVGKSERRVIFQIDIGQVLTSDETAAAVEATGGN